MYDNMTTPSVDGNEAAAAATDNTGDGAYTSCSSGAVENVEAAEPVATADTEAEPGGPRLRAH